MSAPAPSSVEQRGRPPRSGPPGRRWSCPGSARRPSIGSPPVAHRRAGTGEAERPPDVRPGSTLLTMSNQAAAIAWSPDCSRGVSQGQLGRQLAGQVPVDLRPARGPHRPARRRPGPPRPGTSRTRQSGLAPGSAIAASSSSSTAFASSSRPRSISARTRRSSTSTPRSASSPSASTTASGSIAPSVTTTAASGSSGLTRGTGRLRQPEVDAARPLSPVKQVLAPGGRRPA